MQSTDSRTLREAASITDPINRALALQRLITDGAGLAIEACRYRRDAIAEARAQGYTSKQIADRLGVTPGRVRQIPADSKVGPIAPPASETHAPRVLVQRPLPTEPATRGAPSLFLAEMERQGIRADRKMLYIGLEPASEHIATCLRVQTGDDVVARRSSASPTTSQYASRPRTSGPTCSPVPGWPKPEFVRPTLQTALADLGYVFGRAERHLPPGRRRRSSAKHWIWTSRESGSSRSCGSATPARTRPFTASKRSVRLPGTSSLSAR